MVKKSAHSPKKKILKKTISKRLSKIQTHHVQYFLIGLGLIVFFSLIITGEVGQKGSPLPKPAEPTANILAQLTPFPKDISGPWKLKSVNDQAPTNPQDYEIDFLDSGSVRLKLDCNSGVAKYTLLEKTNVTITDVILTKAYCGDESKSDLVAQELVKVTSFQLKDRQVILKTEGDKQIVLER